jgi:hypothetical protein
MCYRLACTCAHCVRELLLRETYGGEVILPDVQQCVDTVQGMTFIFSVLTPVPGTRI